MIFETESSYNYIQVIEEESYRYLFLNDAQAMHSIYHPEKLNYSGPWSQVLVAPYFNAYPQHPETVESMAIIGLAGGTTARQAIEIYDNILIDGFEIDPKVVKVGREYFGMTQSNLNVHVEDGRWGLKHIKKAFDIISVDAYRPPYIPWHMTTVEFFSIVNDHLTEDGVLVINIGRSPMDRTLINDLSTTIAKIFPSIFIMDLPDSYNSVLFATKQPGSWEDFVLNYHMLIDMEAESLLLESMAMTIINRQPTAETTQVYTDDRTPIEWVTNKLVVSYLLTGGMEDLQ
jgi:spermidine synthase